MSKKEVIREGDWVEIINPVFVQRWGYDNNLEDEALALGNQYFDEIMDLAKKIVPGHESDVFNRISRVFAYYSVKKKMRSGMERKLYTKEFPELKGHLSQVREKKNVWTGTYVPPTCEHNYDGSWDSDPGYLLNPVHHQLLNVNCGPETIWIERTNVLTGKTKLV